MYSVGWTSGHESHHKTQSLGGETIPGQTHISPFPVSQDMCVRVIVDDVYAYGFQDNRVM